MMLSGRYLHLVLLLVSLCTVLLHVTSRAETSLSGSVGIDVTAYGFSSTLNNQSSTNTYRTTRSLSNHYVDANLSGTLVNERFAAYVLRGRALGAFSQSSTETSTNNAYLSPALDSYYSSLVVFPERRYPLRLFLGRQFDRQLEYESKNRTVISSAQPSLSVVRRYRRESSRRGVAFDLKLAEKATIAAQTVKSETESLREYDFDEDRDIWVDTSVSVADLLTDEHTVEVINLLPDADVRVLFGNYDTTLAPAQFAELQVDSGSYQVLVLPLTFYNQLDFAVRVISDQIWRIEYNEPLSPRDQKSKETGSRVAFDLGETGEKALSASYDHTDRFDPFTGQTTVRDMANSLIEYRLSESKRLKFETGYSRNRSLRASVVTQENSTLSHETFFEHQSRRGITGMIMHEFSRAKTLAGNMELQTDINRIRSRAIKPFRAYKYQVELESNISLKSDNTGTSTDQYDAGLSNRMEVALGGMRWRPTNRTMLTLRDRTRQDGSTNHTSILETNFSLDGTSLTPTVIGDLSVKGSYSYRKQSDEAGSDVKTLYGFDVLISRSLGRPVRLDLITIQKWETFGGSTPQAGPNQNQATPARPTDHKSTYRGDIKVNPVENLSIALNYSVVTERLSQISQMGASINTTLPLLYIPLTSSMMKTNRDIGDLPRQSVLNWVSELKYRYRQIEFALEHSYSKEELIAQTFSFYEVLITITRGFGR